jgi:hypothetical protein
MAQMTMKSVTHFANSLITSLFIIVFGFSNPAKAADVNPLRAVDASRPRATLQGLIETIDEAYLGMTDFLESYAVSNRLYLSPEERKRQFEILSNGDIGFPVPIRRDVWYDAAAATREAS